MLWWTISFWSTSTSAPLKINTHINYYPEALKEAHLSPISRDDLHKALAGNIELMTKLIADWEIEAQLLTAEGRPNIKHLRSDIFLRSQKIGRSYEIQHEVSSHTYLPQTYVASSILLALLPPDKIVAIPRGLREQTQLFPTSITNQIPLDVDRYSSETLYRLCPHIAFIAPYSCPATIEKLTQQNIRLINLDTAKSLEDIKQTLIKVGHAINLPLKAELMAIFIESAMNAMDNRIAVLQKAEKDSPLKTMYLTYTNRYTMPTSHTLKGHMLQRLGIEVSHEDGWEIALDKELIFKRKPDCLIIASPLYHGLKYSLENETAFLQQKVFVVDENIQEFPSQYIILAYFDIYQALLGARS